MYFTLSGALVLAGTRAGAGQWIVCGDRSLAFGVVELLHLVVVLLVSS